MTSSQKNSAKKEPEEEPDEKPIRFTGDFQSCIQGRPTYPSADKHDSFNQVTKVRNQMLKLT